MAAGADAAMADTHAAALVVALGGYMTAAFGRSFYRGWASTHWPRTTARILSSQVVVADIGRARPVNLEGAAHVSYSYEVGEELYVGSRIRFGPEWWWLAGRDVRAYPPGTVVEVAYDRRAPKRSVLRPGLSWSNTLALPTSVAVLMAGLAWLIRSLTSAA